MPKFLVPIRLVITAEITRTAEAESAEAAKELVGAKFDPVSEDALGDELGTLCKEDDISIDSVEVLDAGALETSDDVDYTEGEDDDDDDEASADTPASPEGEEK